MNAPLLGDSSLEFVEEVFVRVLDLVNVGLLLRQETGDFFVLFAKYREYVLRFLDDPREIGCILQDVPLNHT